MPESLIDEVRRLQAEGGGAFVSQLTLKRIEDALFAGSLPPRTKGPPYPCCPDTDCMICGAPRPSGHHHVLPQGSAAKGNLRAIARVCSSHSFLDLAKDGRFFNYLEFWP